jgi:proteasome lid subunit RPN8/RPN11
MTGAAWSEIARHALETYPEECCGIIVSNGANDLVRRCRNIQNDMHRLDPQSYPRDATIAYTIDPKELISLLREAEERGERLKAFYHSHPDHDAYFSDEDKACAMPFGEPSYADAAQIVVSVRGGQVKAAAAFGWNAEKKDYVRIPLHLPELRD